MKKIYLTIGLVCAGLIPNNSYSQQVKDATSIDIPCYDTKELFKSLREKYKELPLITGTADDEAKSTISIWMNYTEKSWTIVATKNDLSCVVGLGTDMKILKYKLGTSI